MIAPWSRGPGGLVGDAGAVAGVADRGDPAAISRGFFPPGAPTDVAPSGSARSAGVRIAIAACAARERMTPASSASKAFGLSE
jgi:hypothetical protein